MSKASPVDEGAANEKIGLSGAYGRHNALTVEFYYIGSKSAKFANLMTKSKVKEGMPK